MSYQTNIMVKILYLYSQKTDPEISKDFPWFLNETNWLHISIWFLTDADFFFFFWFGPLVCYKWERYELLYRDIKYLGLPNGKIVFLKANIKGCAFILSFKLYNEKGVVFNLNKNEIFALKTLLYKSQIQVIE